MQNPKADAIKPVVVDMVRLINDGTMKVKAYVDNKVDPQIALAANAQGGAAVTIEVLVSAFASLVAVSQSFHPLRSPIVDSDQCPSL